MSKKITSLALAPVISLKPAIGLPIICESVLFQPMHGVMREHKICHNVEFGVTNEEKVKNLVEKLNRALGVNIGVPGKWGESTLFSIYEKDWRGRGKIIFIRDPGKIKTGFLKLEITVYSPHEYVAQRMRKILETFRTRQGRVEEHRTRDGQGIQLRRGFGKGPDDASVVWMRSVLRRLVGKRPGRKQVLERRIKKKPPKRVK